MITDDLPVWRTKKYADLTLQGVSGDGVFSGYASLFGEVDLGKALAAEKAMREHAKSKFAGLVDEIERDKKFSKDVEAKLHDVVKDFKKTGAF